MREFMLLYIGDEWRQVRLLFGSSTHYTVIDCYTGRSGRVEKWKVWRAAQGPQSVRLVA